MIKEKGRIERLISELCPDGVEYRLWGGADVFLPRDDELTLTATCRDFRQVRTVNLSA